MNTIGNELINDLQDFMFNEENIKTLKGHIAIGHTRYSTTGGNTLNNVQPISKLEKVSNCNQPLWVCLRLDFSKISR